MAPLESETLPVSDPLVAPTVCAPAPLATSIDKIHAIPHTTTRLLRMTLSFAEPFEVMDVRAKCKRLATRCEEGVEKPQ